MYPTRAGLNILCPNPPNIIFAIMLEKKHPINNTHIGVLNGNIKDNNKPGIMEYDFNDASNGLYSNSLFFLFLEYKFLK